MLLAPFLAFFFLRDGRRFLKYLAEAVPNAYFERTLYMPEDPAKLKRAAKKLGLELSTRKSGFLFQGDDRIGAMSEVFDKLADARINLIAVDAVSSGKGRFGAIFWVKPEAVAKTARLLGAK